MAGSELLLLHGIARAIANMLLNRFALMTHHHDGRCIADLVREVDYVVDERPSRGAMEHFDRARLHARAEAGGHDDDLQLVAHCSLRIRSSVRP